MKGDVIYTGRWDQKRGLQFRKLNGMEMGKTKVKTSFMGTLYQDKLPRLSKVIGKQHVIKSWEIGNLREDKNRLHVNRIEACENCFMVWG